MSFLSPIFLLLIVVSALVMMVGAWSHPTVRRWLSRAWVFIILLALAPVLFNSLMHQLPAAWMAASSGSGGGVGANATGLLWVFVALIVGNSVIYGVGWVAESGE